MCESRRIFFDAMNMNFEPSFLLSDGMGRFSDAISVTPFRGWTVRRSDNLAPILQGFSATEDFIFHVSLLILP